MKQVELKLLEFLTSPSSKIISELEPSFEHPVNLAQPSSKFNTQQLDYSTTKKPKETSIKNIKTEIINMVQSDPTTNKSRKINR